MELKKLKNTCNYISETIPGSKFIKTKWGGYFEKGNRKIAITISKKNKTDEQSFKINKWKKGFGINLDQRDISRMTKIRTSVKKGLGYKDPLDV